MGEIIKFKPKKKKTIYIALSLLLLTTLILLYINLAHSAYNKTLSLNRTSIMSLEDSSYSFGKAEGNIIVCGQEGLSAINRNGDIVWKYSYPMSNPIISTSGNYSLYADFGGKACHVVSRGKLVSSYESPYEIITAKVNDNGYYAVASKERGYKSQVVVFDRNGNKLFAWHSTQYYVLDVAVTNDNSSLFVSALNTESEDSSISKVLYFSFRSDEPVILETGDNNLIASLCTSQTNVLAIGDFGMYAFDRNGKRIFVVNYEGRTLQEYSLGSGIIALGLTKGSVEGYYGGSVIEVYNMRGSLRGKYEIDDEVKFLDAEGNKILVNSLDGAYILSDTGRLYGNITYENDVREGMIFDGGKKLMLVNGSNVNVYDAK
ncbi:MAG: hypothetical protein IJT38_01005 [Clostridia bacterium]|nr:hypothetical protein [Clostridia bacterium]